MQEASDLPYQRCYFWINSMEVPLLLCKGLFHIKLLSSTNPYGFTESGRQPIRIIRIVIVGVAVVVHITEVVGVAGIRRTLPPVVRRNGNNYMA